MQGTHFTTHVKNAIINDWRGKFCFDTIGLPNNFRLAIGYSASVKAKHPALSICTNVFFTLPDVNEVILNNR